MIAEKYIIFVMTAEMTYLKNGFVHSVESGLRLHMVKNNPLRETNCLYQGVA